MMREYVFCFIFATECGLCGGERLRFTDVILVSFSLTLLYLQILYYDQTYSRMFLLNIFAFRYTFPCSLYRTG